MPQDKYHSLAALKAALSEDVDYRVCVRDRASWATIISPHGGYIDAGSSAIAKCVAGRQYNLYDFQGLRKKNAAELHVTSTRFRDPLLTPLLKTSTTAIAIHWMGTTHESVIWLGGMNYEFKKIVLAELNNAGFAVNPDSPRYRGESLQNVVNLPCRRGVQLEISDELMQELFVGSAFLRSGRKPRTTAKFDKLIHALRDSLNLYCQDGVAPCQQEQAS